MNRLSPVQRKLFVHSAHRTIGVSGGGMALRPYCRVDDSWPERRVSAERFHVALVADRHDPCEDAAREAFYRVMGPRRDLCCFDVEPAEMDVMIEERSHVDGAVLFHRGLHIAGHGSRFRAEIFLDADEKRYENNPIQVEIVPVGSHPILEGIEPFKTELSFLENAIVSSGATVLLAGATRKDSHPVAWLAGDENNISFHTLLGSPEDYCQRFFCSFLDNALDWVIRDKGERG